MTMTDDEKKRFIQLEENVEEILRALKGDRFTGQIGLIRDLKEMKKDLNDVKSDFRGFKEQWTSQYKKIKPILIALGAGFAFGGLAFGFISGKAVVEWLKHFF